MDLPFSFESGNADSEYLSDGLAESLIYRLSQVSNLKVTPRSSAFRYKGKQMDAEKIGEELGVDAVMSGRLIQRGDDLVISVCAVLLAEACNVGLEPLVRPEVGDG